MVDEAIPLHSVAFVIRVTGTVVGFALISGRFRFKGGIVLSFRRRPHLDPEAVLAIGYRWMVSRNDVIAWSTVSGFSSCTMWPASSITTSAGQGHEAVVHGVDGTARVPGCGASTLYWPQVS